LEPFGFDLLAVDFLVLAFFEAVFFKLVVLAAPRAEVAFASVDAFLEVGVREAVFDGPVEVAVFGAARLAVDFFFVEAGAAGRELDFFLEADLAALFLAVLFLAVLFLAVPVREVCADRPLLREAVLAGAVLRPNVFVFFLEAICFRHHRTPTSRVFWAAIAMR